MNSRRQSAADNFLSWNDHNNVGRKPSRWTLNNRDSRRQINIPLSKLVDTNTELSDGELPFDKLIVVPIQCESQLRGNDVRATGW